MMHASRPHTVTAIAESVTDSAIAALADKLSRYSWTLCTGFRLGDLLFLNDATSADGAQEYAVLRATPNADGTHTQIESITCSWLATPQLCSLLRGLYGLDPLEPAPESHARVVVATSASALRAALGSPIGRTALDMGRYPLQPHPIGVCSRCA